MEESGTFLKKKSGLKLKIKIGNPSLRRLISGAIAGAVSRTYVAPLETIRTHLMVGSVGHSTTEVFQDIMQTEGWTGLFRGNFVNVIHVAPSKAIEEPYSIRDQRPGSIKSERDKHVLIILTGLTMFSDLPRNRLLYRLIWNEPCAP